jgi:hypothetical protein
MSSRNRSDCAGRLATALVLASATALAAPQSESERLFYEGRERLERQDYDLACEKLERSQKLDPAVGTLALLAYCHEMQGRTATAYTEYNEALELARQSGDPERRRAIEQRLERLTPKLSRITLVVDRSVAGLELTIAGRKVPDAEWGDALPYDPGTLLVEATAPNHRSWSASVTLGGDGARVEVTVPPLAPLESEPAAPASHFNAPVLVAFGVGAAGILAGSYFGLRARSLDQDSESGCDAQSRCTQEGFDLRKDAQTAARTSNVAFGIGAAGVVTGVVLLLLRRPASEPPAAALEVQPAARGGWVAYRRRF